ncbi:MAG: hypothetical protein AAFO91_13990, partial [Bacteroidota bacterium]
HRVHIFKSDPHDTTQLLTNFASQGEIQEDQWGSLWISNATCLIRFFPSEQRFERILLPYPNSSDTIRDGYYFMKLDYEKNRLYTVANEHLFVLYLTEKAYQSSFIDHFDRNAYDYMSVRKDGRMDYLHFANHPDSLLWIIYEDSLRHQAPTGYPTPNGEYIKELTVDHHGQVWIASSSGLLKLDLSTGQYESKLAYLGNRQKAWSRIYPRGKEQLILATEEGGVYVYDKLRDSLTHQVRHASYDRFPVFEQNIDALMVDRQDNFWFSLKGDGVRYSNFSKSKIDQFGLDQGGEPLGLCNALFEDEENNIWILGDTAVIGLRDQKRVSYPIGIDGKSNDQTRFLYVDPLKNCWVGTLSGLYYKPSMAARFERINVRIDGLLPDKSPGYQDFTATPNGSFLISGNEG